MPSCALVTGATGNVGSAVVAALRDREAALRVADRDPARARDLLGEVDAVRLDFTDASTFGPALTGVDSVFLVRPPAIARVGPTINRFLDAAAEAGVEHVVFASVAGAESNRIVPHHRIERHLVGSSLAWTILRPGFFAQNIGTAYRDDIVHHDRIVVPAGDGRAAFVDTRDLGEAAAIALCDGACRGRAFHLTGPHAVSFEEVTERLSGLVGRPIRYEPAGIVRYLRHLRRAGLPVMQCVVQTVLHVGLRRGDAEEVTDELERLLGRPPRTLEDYLVDHLDRFVADSASPERDGAA